MCPRITGRRVADEKQKFRYVLGAATHYGEHHVARFDTLEDGDGFGVREADQRLAVDG